MYTFKMQYLLTGSDGWPEILGRVFLCNACVLTGESKPSPGAIAISLEIALKGFPRCLECNKELLPGTIFLSQIGPFSLLPSLSSS